MHVHIIQDKLNLHCSECHFCHEVAYCDFTINIDMFNQMMYINVCKRLAS